jgi:hypothetical protein
VARLVIVSEVTRICLDLVEVREWEQALALEFQHDDGVTRQDDYVGPASPLEGQFELECHTPVSGVTVCGDAFRECRRHHGMFVSPGCHLRSGRGSSGERKMMVLEAPHQGGPTLSEKIPHRTRPPEVRAH